MINVVIVEDDPMVMDINRKMLEKNEDVSIIRTFSNGRSALEWLSENKADLCFLDVYMPQLNGLEVLSGLRSRSISTDVIMITAANDMDTLQRTIHLGVIDYLVKPFDEARLNEALQKYRQWHLSRQEKNQISSSLAQDDIDQLLQGRPLFPVAAQSSADSEDSFDQLEKGLHRKTMDIVISSLKAAQSPVTVGELGTSINLSRITARKYLNYLDRQGLLDTQIDYDTGGRPRILYSLKEK